MRNPIGWVEIATTDLERAKTSYEKAVTMLKKSHDEAMKLIESFSNKELFTKKYFNWTGTTSVGSYCVSSTSSHYDWAIQKLKKHKRNCK